MAKQKRATWWKMLYFQRATIESISSQDVGDGLKAAFRYFDGEELTRALTKNGFEDVRVYGDRTFEAPGAEEMRMHLTARRI